MCALNIEAYLVGFWIFWLHSCLMNHLLYTMHVTSRPPQIIKKFCSIEIGPVLL